MHIKNHLPRYVVGSYNLSLNSWMYLELSLQLYNPTLNFQKFFIHGLHECCAGVKVSTGVEVKIYGYHHFQ